MVKVGVLSILLFLTASIVLIIPLSVRGDSKTIVVPDDYPTITCAIGNATSGDTIFVKKGNYEERTIEISKSLSLIGEDLETTIITLYPPYNETTIISQTFYDYSNAIVIDASDVRVSNLAIIVKPGGTILVNGNKTKVIKNNIQTGNTEVTGLSVNGYHCEIVENSLIGSIYLKSSNNEIARNIISGDVTLQSADSNSIKENTCTHLKLGYENQTCFYNVILKNNIETKTRELYGISLTSGLHNTFCENNITGYSHGLVLGSGWVENNTFYHNSFINNDLEQVITYEGEFLGKNFWDNGKEGNYWNDFNATDGNMDGLADSPYVINSENIDHYPLMFPFAVDNDTFGLPPSEPFPLILIASASGATVAVVVSALIYFFRSRKNEFRATSS